MAEWKEVDTDFGGEETINFGARQETGSALYQVTTLATIEPSGEPLSNPAVTACFTEEIGCVSVGNHLSLFEESCHIYLSTLKFESDIEAVCISEDGRFLFLGEQSGHLHFVDIQSQQKLISKKLFELKENNTTSYTSMQLVESKQHGCASLIVLASSGQLFIFDNIKLRQLEDAMDGRDMELVQKLHGEMKLQMADVGEVQQQATALCVVTDEGELSSVVTVGKGDIVLSVWEMDNGLLYLADSTESVISSEDGTTGVLKSRALLDGKSLLTLGENNVLVMWDLHTLTIVNMWSDLTVEDFYIQEMGAESQSSARLAVLTSPDGSNKDLQILSMPDMQTVYTLQLSAFCSFGKMPSGEDSIYLLEGVDSDGKYINPSDQLISCLRVRCLNEAQPQTRLSRLLGKKQFEQAEAFAKQFNLIEELQLVYTTKGNHLLDVLSQLNQKEIKTHQAPDLFAEFLECLKEIQDSNHVILCCVSAAMPTFSMMLELINYTSKMLESMYKKDQHGEQKENLEDLQTLISEKLHRLGTFQVAFGAEQYSAKKWEHFSKAVMLEEFLKWIEKGELDIAFTIWQRHQCELEQDVNEDLFNDILMRIPEAVPSHQLKPWLKQDLIPFIMKTLPEGMKQFAFWIEQRARNMELFEKAGWPQNALDLCELLQDVCLTQTQITLGRGFSTPKMFSTQVCNLSVGYAQINSSTENQQGCDAFVSLHSLTRQLRDLVDLHTKYKCKLSLAEYCRETAESVTYRMLDHVVALELIPSTIENILRPYMREHNLKEDRMLYQYIGDIAQRAGRMKSYTGRALWEAKAITVISCIKDPEYKILAILEIAKRAYTPWSDKMASLVQEGLKVDHPKVSELQEQCQLMEMKKILLSYDLHNYNVADVCNAEALMKYILVQDRPSALEDAMKIIKAYDHLKEEMAYIFWMNCLIEKDRSSQALELLKGLEEDVAFYCGKYLVTSTLLSLNDQTLLFDSEEGKLSLSRKTEAVISVIRHILTFKLSGSDRDEMSLFLEELKAMHALQVEHGKFLTFTEYSDDKTHKVLVTDCIHSYLNELSSASVEKKTECISLARVIRIGNLLKFRRSEVNGLLAVEAAERGMVDVATKLCRDLYKQAPDENTADVLCHVAYIFSGMVRDRAACAKTLPAVIQEFANQALVFCRDDTLADCLKLSRCASMAHDVSLECETGEYGSSLQGATNEEGELKDLLVEHFSEDGFVMESSVALPLAYNYLSTTCSAFSGATTETQEVKEEKVEDAEEKVDGKQGVSSSIMQALVNQGPRLIRHWQENSHTMLALQYSIDALGTVVQYISSKSMGFSLQPQEEEDLAKEERLVHAVGSLVETSILESLALDTFHKVLSKQRVDYQLALCLLVTMETKDVLLLLEKLTKSAGQHYKKTMVISKIGKAYAQLDGMTAAVKISEVVHNNAEWAHILTKMKIKVNEDFLKDPHRRQDFIHEMVLYPQVDATLIMRFCSTFGLSREDALYIYLKELLLPTSKHRYIDQKSITTVLQKANITAGLLANSAKLYDELLAIYQRVCPYDYERIEFVLRRLHSIKNLPWSDKALQILNFLKTYKRVAPPLPDELHYQKEDSDVQLQDFPLAHSRVPLHPLLSGDADSHGDTYSLKIISQELREDNYDVWIPIATLCEHELDHLYLATIKNIVKDHVAAKQQKSPAGSKKTQSSPSWDPEDTVDHGFFSTVSSLIAKMSTPERAVSSATWVLKQFPQGAEKVFALENAVKLAKQWLHVCEKDTPEAKKAEATYNQFRLVYRRISTEQILCCNHLNQPELLDLAGSPSALIFKLYEHESILQRGGGTIMADTLPDIHKIAKAIAGKCQLSLDKIHVKLLEKWLPSLEHGKQDNLDVTMNLSPELNLDSTFSTDSMEEDWRNLHRTIYVLQYGSLDKNSLFLLNYAKTESSKISHMCRVRALVCLFALLDQHTIEKLCEKSVEDIRQEMEALMYLSELGKVHVPLTLQSFASCNKEGLVKGIFRKHLNNPQAVRLITDICLDFDIYDEQLWNMLLKQLYKFDMMDFLSHVLISLSRIPQLWHVQCIQQMWKAVLLKPLKDAVLPLTEEQEMTCLQSAVLLHRCPLVLQLDIEELNKEYQRLGMPACAMGCVTMVPDEQCREQLVQQVLQASNLVEVLEKAVCDGSGGHMLPMRQQIETAVYQYVAKHQQFKQLEGTCFFDLLVAYLLRTHNISSILLYGLQQGRIVEAEQLIQAYVNQNPDSAFAQECKDQTSSQKILRMYAKLHKEVNLIQYLSKDEQIEEEEEQQEQFNQELNED